MNSTDIDNFNLLGEFCGQRDLSELTSKSLNQQFGLKKADVFVLFGGSILYGVDVLAEAIKNQIADKYVIVGGFGHTTETLQKTVARQNPDIPAQKMQEAEIFSALLKKRFNLTVDLLETQSTNCGNNITNLLNVLKSNQIKFDSIILAQDATMQRRMSACLKKYVSPKIKIINYATYQVRLTLQNKTITYTEKIPGMWQPKRYMTLLMGEIPRLLDDKNGYGPKGKNFIAHVDIPEAVLKAYQDLNHKYPDIKRPGKKIFS